MWEHTCAAAGWSKRRLADVRQRPFVSIAADPRLSLAFKIATLFEPDGTAVTV